jgi:hypothetical protein
MNIKEFMIPEKDERPLDRIVSDGGYTAIFSTIGCIGDSLSSGEFEIVDQEGHTSYHDLFHYSWGQFLARMSGCKVYNFSRGGMTAREYVESFAEERGFWNPELACKAYVIALGVNDLVYQNHPVGSKEDVFPSEPSENPKTFMGYMGQILSRLRKIAPNSPVFLVTMPKDGHGERERGALQRKLMYNLADLFPSVYVIDLFEYGPVYDENFKKNFYLNGHMNPQGYYLTAKMIASYIDYIVRLHPKDFEMTAF